MWYIDGHKWDSDTYNEAVDGMFNNAAMAEAVMGLVESESRGMLLEARCHGNPFFDTDSIGWEEHTDQKRAENDAYRADAASETFGFKAMFQAVPPAERYVQGSFYIVGIDEPEYAEHGDMYIHERLTSHLAEPATLPRSEWEPWMPYVYDDYVDDIFIKNLAYGQIPSPIIVEPQRQRMGLPYEWFGAAID